MQRVISAITALWNRGCLGKAVIIFLALFIIGVCSAPFRGASTPAAAPTQTPAQVAAQATEPPAPTDAPRATRAPRPTRTPEPTETMIPTFTPVPTPTRNPALKAEGVPPLNKDDCPDDYPIKGNITSKGKIYHLGDPSYNQTDPEICFAYIADAVAAGFRAP